MKEMLEENDEEANEGISEENITEEMRDENDDTVLEKDLADEAFAEGGETSNKE